MTNFVLSVVLGKVMEVMLTDSSQVSVMHTCLMPLIVHADRDIALHTVVKLYILPQLNHDIVLGINWLMDTNPIIDWQACTVSVESAEHQGAVTLHELPTSPVAKIELWSNK